MGSCSSQPDKIIVSNPPSRGNKTNEVLTKKNDTGNLDSNLEKQNLDPKFRDMPEWEGDRFRGEGIKRMKGYKCSMQIDKLNSLRDEFWTIKMKDKLIWKHLRQACNMDDVRSAQIIKQLGLNTINGCLNHLIDENGNRYYIPNFCINDPFFEKEMKDLSGAQGTTDKKVKIYVNDLYANKKIPLELPLTSTGKDVKNLYFYTIDDSMEKYKTRIFFGGVEIHDDQVLAQHNIKDEYQVQIIKTLID